MITDETLEKRLDQLSSTVAEKRMTELAQQCITAWEKRRVAALVVVLALFGVASYSALRDRIVSYFATSVFSQIDSEVKKKTASVSVQDPAIADLRIQVLDLRREIETLSKPKVPVSPPKAISSGFAFVGIRDESGQWSEKYFEVIGGGDRPPQAGDRLRALSSVNARMGYIIYSEAGWVNKPSIGVLRRGEIIRVDETRQVVPGFWWVAFTYEAAQ